VADALDREAEVGEVSVVQARRRIVPFEVRQRRCVDEQGHRQLAVDLAQQELLARRARRADLVARFAVDDERLDRQLRLDPIQRLESQLQPRAATRSRGPRRGASLQSSVALWRHDTQRRQPRGGVHALRPLPLAVEAQDVAIAGRGRDAPADQRERTDEADEVAASSPNTSPSGSPVDSASPRASSPYAVPPISM
jgi:hypothetical protein